MPPRKQKQKQKQTQRQSVIVNIGEKKKAKRKPRKKAAAASEQLPPPVVLGLPKVPPILVQQYTEPASLMPPQPPRQEPARQEPAIFAAPRQAIPFAQEQQQGFQIPAPRQPAREAAREAAERRREAEAQVEIPEPQGLQARPSAREAAVFAAQQRDIFARQQRPAFELLQPAPPMWEQLVAEGPRAAEPVIAEPFQEGPRAAEPVIAEPLQEVAGGELQAEPLQVVSGGGKKKKPRRKPKLVIVGEEKPEPVIAGGVAISEAVTPSKKRGPYRPRAELSKKALQQAIIDMNMGYTITRLKKFYPTKEQLQSKYDELIAGGK